MGKRRNYQAIIMEFRRRLWRIAPFESREHFRSRHRRGLRDRRLRLWRLVAWWPNCTHDAAALGGVNGRRRLQWGQELGDAAEEYIIL